MSDYFYRFRSAAALLEGFHELENQEIYFPTLKELNDPLEGFKDVVWEGDRIVWHNLFRHYVLCLLESMFRVVGLANEFTPEAIAKVIFLMADDLPAAQIRDIYATACETIFSHSPLVALLDLLEKPGKTVRRDELVFYLQFIHPFAFLIIIELLAKFDIEFFHPTVDISALSSKTLDLIPEIARIQALNHDSNGEIFAINNRVVNQISLINQLINEIPDEKKSLLFLVQEFPSFYIDNLEKLLYPDWHAACFVTNPTGAAMWGHYGDGHQGMCLKFKAKPGPTGESYLDLKRINRWNASGSHSDFVPHPFVSVDYKSTFPEVNFFKSLGRLNRERLERGWYQGQKGELSKVATSIFEDHDQWRQHYWNRFQAIYRTKAEDWATENEHRIVLFSTISNYDTIDSRKLKYRFEDLKGIIFGLRTSITNKLAAIRIVQQKCLASSRTDFEFLQAYYSHRTGQIKIAPLDLLKFKPGAGE